MQHPGSDPSATPRRPRPHLKNYIYGYVSKRPFARDADPFGNISATIDDYTANNANTRERRETPQAF